jgi:dolichol-phosphate mannosyltransferase
VSRILIVAPAFNEADGIQEFVAEVDGLRTRLPPQHQLRLLLVDDGSTDGTLDVLRQTVARHPEWCSYLSFAANAGHQAALIAGLSNAGPWPDAIVTMDSDLEHPMEVVPLLLEAWTRTGALVVHAIRRESSALSWTKRWPSAAFYRLTSRLTGLSLSPGQADFRLWDGATVRGVLEYLPHIGSLRVFAAWMPGRKASIEFDQRVRSDRKTRFTFRKNYELAAISIVRFSNVPLQAITLLGIIGLVFSAVYAGFIAAAAARGVTTPGWSSLILTVLIMGCLQLVALGVLAGYLRRLVFARDLPSYIIRESRLVDEAGVPAAGAVAGHTRGGSHG